MKLPPMKRPDVLRPLFGENLEHWDESPSQMLATRQGQDRAKQWLWHAHHDPGYAKRLEELNSQIEDKSARYATIISEYRNARRQDARGFAPSHAADLAISEAALTALPAGRVFNAMRGAGATRAAARAAAIKEAALPVAMLGGLGMSPAEGPCGPRSTPGLRSVWLARPTAGPAATARSQGRCSAGRPA